MNIGAAMGESSGSTKTHMKMGGESVGLTERIGKKGVGGIFHQYT